MVDVAPDDGHDGGDMAQIQLAYPIPMPAIMTQSYADHVRAARANGWSNYNGGIDWAIPQGTPVSASAVGRVTVARHDATGYGMHVRISHDGGWLTIYAHLSQLMVQVGETVRAGQVIGKSGNTGNSTGPHLHFEVRHNGYAVDPQPLFVQPDPGEPPVTVGRRVEAGDMGRITGVGLRIRSAPTLTDDTIIGHAVPGAIVPVDAVTDDWVRVVAWISRDWIEAI